VVALGEYWSVVVKSRLLAINLIMVVICALGTWAYLQIGELVGFSFFVFAILCCYGVMIAREIGAFETRVIFSCVIVVSVAFGIGAIQAKRVLKATANHVVEVSGKTVTGVLIRSGERGLLLFETTTKQLVIVPWSSASRVTALSVGQVGVDNWRQRLGWR
jgi:hypothetical protein